MKSNKVLAAVACLILLNLTLVSSSCSSDQININEASKSELQKIDQIGPTYANRTVNKRPFDSLPGLKKVDGIADGRLENIKKQGLACVEDPESKEESTEESQNKDEAENEDIEETKKEQEKEPKNQEANPERKEENSQENQKSQPQNPIKLDAKDIKNQTNTKDGQNKGNYTKYGLTGITVLVIFLFLAREIKHKKKYKNEFSG